MPNRLVRLCVILSSLFLLHPGQLHAAPYLRSWIQEYDLESTDAQEAKAIGIDSRGNVIVAGSAEKPGSSEEALYIAKYDGFTGEIIWERTLTATNDMVPTSLAIDSTDSIVIVGTRNDSSDEDFFIMKVNSVGNNASGFSIPIVYDGTAGGFDSPAKVIVDSDDNIIVVGISFVESGGQGDFYTRKLSPTGTLLGEDRYNPFNRNDAATDVAVDSDDNIIVVGSVTNSDSDIGIQFVIRKLNTSVNPIWTRLITTSSEGDGDGGATAVAVDAADNVFATGLFTNVSNHHGYYTIKYDVNTFARRDSFYTITQFFT